MTRNYALGLVLAFALAAASPALGQGDGQKVLDEWAKFVTGGTWVTTRVTGEKQEHTFRWRTPGKLLDLDGRGGPLPFVAMIAVDPATKQCAWNVYNDDGTTIKGTLTQPAAGVWTYEEAGAGANGAHRYKSKIIRVDADTAKEEPSEFVINGKPQPLDAATWKRTGHSTRKDFEEYCQVNQGRFVGEVTWVTDWAGFGKRGDKVTAYFQGTIAEDGNALVGTFHGGNGSGFGITFYDAETKQIKELIASSGGTIWENVISKEDGRWVSRSISGSTPDGSPVRGTSLLTISDGGNTLTWTGTGTVGGKPTDPQKDVWRRVSKK